MTINGEVSAGEGGKIATSEKIENDNADISIKENECNNKLVESGRNNEIMTQTSDSKGNFSVKNEYEDI